MGAPIKEVWLVGAGMYSSWIYLRLLLVYCVGFREYVCLSDRFFAANPTTGRNGDDREEFSLAALFPPIIRCVICRCYHGVCDVVE